MSDSAPNPLDEFVEELAETGEDPFGNISKDPGRLLGPVAPVVSWMTTGLGHEGPELNDQLAEQQAAQSGGRAKTGPPSMADATTSGLGNQVRDLQRKRASRTLFTGARGLDQPATASQTLLGS